jgi:hypothetical protein
MVQLQRLRQVWLAEAEKVQVSGKRERGAETAWPSRS